jgi:excisionase family DNA binding protein
VSPKVQPTHLERVAVVYVRQSTYFQVEKHRESALLQYNLAEFAQRLGWRSDQVVIIDEDQGHSGATTHQRAGFARLMSEVGLSKVGIVLAFEASRLARNNADWQRLIWFCSLTETLLGDQDGVYDPSLLDDRMVLGLKGTISELEWHTIRRRMRQAALAKAGRGELQIRLPAGLQWHELGGIHFTADERVNHALRTVFDKFKDLGSARQVALWMRDHGIQLPRTEKRNAQHVHWVDATGHAVCDVLKNPFYAGAYVYGRRRTTRRIEADGSVRTQSRHVAQQEWMIVIPEHHEGFVSWKEYEQIRRRLAENYTKGGLGPQGPARNGVALLQGLAYCGRCGRRMSVAYPAKSKRRFGQFVCRALWKERGAQFFCQVFGGIRIEKLVVEMFLDAIQPAGVEVALLALEGIRQQQQVVARHWQQRIEHAEYEAHHARAHYEAVDPANRLVAANLERQWNEALAAVEQTRREAELQLERATHELTEFERRRIEQMARNVGRIWTAPTTTPRDQKRLLRAAIERVVLSAAEHHVEVAVEWKGGEVTKATVERRRRGEPTCLTDTEVVELVRRLAADGFDDTQIARVLSRRGMRTATGLTFTRRRVQSIRVSRNIPSGTTRPRRAEDALTVEQAAAQLGVCGRTVHEWLQTGLLRGTQSMPGAPWQVELDQDTRRKLTAQDAPPGWVGLTEAARRLGVSKQTVASWVKSGRLEAVRVTRGRRPGWRIRVDSAELQRQRTLL